MKILYLHSGNSLHLLLDSLAALRALARVHVDLTVLAGEPAFSLLAADPLLPRVVKDVTSLKDSHFDLAIVAEVGKTARVQLAGVSAGEVLFPLECPNPGLEGPDPELEQSAAAEGPDPGPGPQEVEAARSGSDPLGYTPDLLPFRLREHGLLPSSVTLGAPLMAVPGSMLQEVRGRLLAKRPAVVLAGSSALDDFSDATRHAVAALRAATGAHLLEVALPLGLEGDASPPPVSPPPATALPTSAPQITARQRAARERVSLPMLAALCSAADLVLTDEPAVVRLAATAGGRALRLEGKGREGVESEALLERALPLLERVTGPVTHRAGRPAPARRTFSARELLAPRKIAAFRLDSIGEVALAGPALRALKDNFPHASLTLLASPAGAQLAPLLPWVDEVISVRASWQQPGDPAARSGVAEEELVARLFDRHFDAAFIFTSFGQTPHAAALCCRLAGIPVRVGESKEAGFDSLTHQRPPLPEEVHQVDRNLALLEFLGLKVRSRKMELRLPASVQDAAGSLLSQAGIDPQERFLVLSPWATAQARTYPPLRGAQAASLVSRKTRWPVVVVGGGRHVPGGEEIAAEIGRRGVSLVGLTSVAELAAIVARASLVVANDSLCMHLADAFGVPSVIAYSGTRYESQWAPRFSRSRLLRRPTACTACYRFTCPLGLGCLDVAPERLAAEALDLLGRSRTPAKARKTTRAR